jgi:hypothetical protein
MTTLAEAAAQEFGFNPDQVRAPDGKWLHVGGAVMHAVHGKGTVTEKHAFGKVSVRFEKGGLKKVGGKDLAPSGHDPLGEQIDEDVIHARHVAQDAQDHADEEAAHRRKPTIPRQGRNPLDRAAEKAGAKRIEEGDRAERKASAHEKRVRAKMVRAATGTSRRDASGERAAEHEKKSRQKLIDAAEAARRRG